MGHRFGDLIDEYRHRKQGLSLEKLAEGAGISREVLGRMRKGKRLTGPQARERITSIIYRLYEEDVLRDIEKEVNALLTAAGMSALDPEQPIDVKLLRVVSKDIVPPKPVEYSEKETTNLPQHLTPFIGHVQDILNLTMQAQQQRLITLTGAGGVGKTRLAIEVGRGLQSSFADGVWHIELAPITDPNLIPQMIASVLDIHEESNKPLLTTILNFLKAKHLLLILDNCDHLLDACGLIVETVVQQCSRTHLLVTSREPLSITSEIQYRVPSLSLPTPAEVSNFEALLQYEGIEFFVDRARAVQTDFCLTTENAAAVVQICIRLDGIPLAIELATARLNSLSVKQIAARLDNVFQLLTRGSRTALPRHRTLRAMLDWSYDLLFETEKILLYRLSIFSGGWILEAAQAVCHGGSIKEASMLDLLDQLVKKSLVVFSPNGDMPRYHLLETIRQYASEKLFKDEEAEVRERHMQWFLRLAEQTAPNLTKRETKKYLDVLEKDHGNLRKALIWSQATEHGVDTELRFVNALWRFWSIRGHISEGRAMLTKAIARSATRAEQTHPRTRALIWAGHLARTQNDYDQALLLYKTSHALLQKFNDTLGIAHSLQGLGLVAYDRRKFKLANKLLKKSLALFQEVDDEHYKIRSLEYLGMVAFKQGKLDSAEGMLDESLVYFKDVGYTQGIARTLNFLAQVYQARGRYAEAELKYKDSLTMRRDLGEKNGIAYSLNDLGRLYYKRNDSQKDLIKAGKLLEQSLDLFQELDNKGGIATAKSDLGVVAYEAGNYERAKEFLKESLELGQKLRRSDITMHCRKYLEKIAQIEAGHAFTIDTSSHVGGSIEKRAVWSKWAAKHLSAMRHLKAAGILAKDHQFRNVAEHLLVVNAAAILLARNIDQSAPPLRHVIINKASIIHDIAKRIQRIQGIGYEDELRSQLTPTLLKNFGYDDEVIQAVNHIGRVPEIEIKNDEEQIQVIEKLPLEYLVPAYIDARTRNTNIVSLEEARDQNKRKVPKDSEFYDKWYRYYKKVEQRLFNHARLLQPEDVNKDSVFAMIQTE